MDTYSFLRIVSRVLQRGLLVLTLALVLAACDSREAPTELQITTFGSRLANEPANNGECNTLEDPCTIVGRVHFPDPEGPADTDGAPVDGLITRFRVRACAESEGPLPVRLAVAEIVFEQADNERADARVVAKGPPVMISRCPADGDVPVHEFNANLPIAQGQYLAIEGRGVRLTHNAGGSVSSYWFVPPLIEGGGLRTSNGDDGIGELLVQADIQH